MKKKRARELENDQTKKDVARLKRRIDIAQPDPAKIREEWRQYFTARAAKREVVATTKSPSGQTLDWVPIDSQVKRGKVATPPSDSGAMIFDTEKQADRVARFELEDARAPRGPKGTVPIVRKNLSALQYNKPRTWSAYMRNLRYQSGTSGSMTKYAPDTTWVSDANEYDMIGEFGNTGSWKSFFWLGGPGA